MGVELKDFRGRLTPEAWCALEAEARATGSDQQQLVRDILHDWAMRRIHAASVMAKLLQAEGVAGEAEGSCGNRRKHRS